MPSHDYPITVLPHTSRIVCDLLGASPSVASESLLRRVFPSLGPPSARFNADWQSRPAHLTPAHRNRLADLLAAQQHHPAALAAVESLRNGASAVVTGQQPVLFGGPLYTLLKAATAIARARAASAAGHPHVAIFWLATEDHDLAEVNHAELLAADSVESLRLAIPHRPGEPVGALALPPDLSALLDRAAVLLHHAPIADTLRAAYSPGATLAAAAARLFADIFAAEGLIVLDASSRELHALGAPILADAITRAPILNAALRARNAELIAAGYHAQVHVDEASASLFLLDEVTGARNALHLTPESPHFTDAAGRIHSAADLLAILRAAPERISPGALLRPVFQDFILPTSLVIGGPAELAYFAQADVLYSALLGRTTPIEHRLTATLIAPAIAAAMAKYAVDLPQALASPDDLALRIGARSLPPEGKRKLAAAGNQLATELDALTAWMRSMDESLGRSATVSASKMLYQMNRLRRMAANFELHRSQSIARAASAISLHLFPTRHPQERVLAGVQFLAIFGPALVPAVIDAAATPTSSHTALVL
jgi:bacillithiol biosynthesis cysteine-adding enzyme BshC